MSKILLIGYNPPLLMGDSKIEASHYRTWQFLQPLLEDGHRICLVAKDSAENSVTNARRAAEAGLEMAYHAVPLKEKVGWVSQLQKIHDQFEPDCVVAVNYDCALCATKLKTEKPIWMDIYGDYLTIMQVARYRAGTDRGIATSIALAKHVLQRGDKYSVCGTPQQHALVGELAMAGRLNASSFGYEFVHPVLPGAIPLGKSINNREQRTFLGAHGVPRDCFVALWCGGYNTWTDVETLFSGVEHAMAQEPSVHYVSVGANTYEAPDNVYTRLLEMIAASHYRERFHMLGWQPWNVIGDCYQESDLGLNIDALHYETIYGTRTRLVEMLATGLPVVTSTGCELSDLIEQKGAGVTFPSGNWQVLGNTIATIAANQALQQELSDQALDYAENGLSFANTTNAMREWVRNPQQAPDKIAAASQSRFKLFEYQCRSMVRQLMWQSTGLER